MASAGRILIMPKGDWNTETEYEMLDLVYHNGISWLAKKNAVGIEPRDANAEHWMKMCDGADITRILSNYINVNGGTMVVDLGLGGGKGTVHATEFTTYIRAKKDQSNYRDIRITNPGNSESKSLFVKVVDCADGVSTEYKLFGEHNLDLLNQYIDARIAEKMK